MDPIRNTQPTQYVDFHDESGSFRDSSRTKPEHKEQDAIKINTQEPLDKK